MTTSTSQLPEAELATPKTASRPAKRTWRRLALPIAVLYAALLGLWEAGAAAGVIDQFFFPAPSRIGVAVWRLLVNGDVLEASLVTLFEAGAGLVIGSVLGIGLGLILVRFRLLWSLFQPAVYFLYSLPRIALAPLFIVVLGLGVSSKVALVTFAVFFVLVVNTVAGAESIGQHYVRAAKALGASSRQVTWKVIVPGTIAWIFSGLRIAISMAFLSAVVAEFVGATAGLGYRLQLAAVYFDTVQIFAWLFVLGVFSALLTGLVVLLEKRTLKWRPAVDG